MSTRSRIGYVMKTGAIASVYCYNDGYIEGVGHTLLKHYTDPKKIRALIKLGDLSSLHEALAPPAGVKHSFGYAKRAPGVTVAYKRDRGDTDVGLIQSATVEEFLAFDSGQEYSYLWDGKWWVWGMDKPTEKLELAVAAVKERITA